MTRTRVWALAAALLTATPAAGQTPADWSAVPRAERVRRLRQRSWDVTARHTSAPISVDGRLDEDDWRAAAPVADFYQTGRNEGLPASERTEVRVLYDAERIYIGFRAWDSEPDRMRIRSVFRDESGGADELVAVMLDAYHGHRGAIQFVTNANGLMEDLLQTGESTTTRNHDWDTVWASQGRVLADGYEVEMAVPFTSLRFELPREGGDIVFGIGFKRNIPRRNEESVWPFVPNDSSWYRPAELGHLRGLSGVRPGRSIELRPYLLGTALSDIALQRPTQLARDAGVDGKWGVTTGLTADFTLNTDFAQEEADIQQVNLTRFSLFFPEKRQFFLEGQQAFRFGVPREADLIFTRRIGLSAEGTPLPLLGGARLSGRQGRTGLGAMSLQVGDPGGGDSRNYTVVRVKQDVLTRSSVGAVFTNVQGAGSFNRVVGADASLYIHRLWFFDGWAARVNQDGAASSAAVYARSAYEADRRALSYTFLGIGDGFAPEVGYVRRPDSRQHTLAARWSPRPTSDAVRQYHLTGRLGYITDGRGLPETRHREGGLRADFESGDAVSLVFTNNLERLVRPFPLRRGVTIAPGAYRFNEIEAKFDSFRRRHLQLDATYTAGGFFGGHRDALLLAFNWRMSTMVGVTAGYSVNWVDLPQTSLTTHLLTSRLQLAFRNDAALLTLLQFNRDTGQFSANVRFNWIPKPGTDLFVVYNETDDTLGRWAPRTRSLAVKLNYLFAL
ncbi:MAG: DUF5916 domain-containing protein [Acidobacteriota bacterium]